MPARLGHPKGAIRKPAPATGAATESVASTQGLENESEESYSSLFRRLQECGLEKVWLCVSDAYMGLQAAIRSTLHGTRWQRCKVHFMRNILAYVPQKDKEKVAARLKLIWEAPDEKSARAMKAASYLLEYSDDWQTERCYMNAGSIKLQKEILFNAV